MQRLTARGTLPVLFILSAAFLVSRCDLPTSGPDFSFTTGVRAPLIFDKTFVLLGPSDTGFDALIDSTGETFDSLLTVNPGDETIFIIQNVDDFDIGELDDVIPSLDLDPVSVSVSLDSLAEQSFSAGFATTLGTFDREGEGVQDVPVSVSGETVFVDADLNLILPPDVDLLDLSGAGVQFVTFAEAGASFNQLTFTLDNDLLVPITAEGGGPPRLFLDDTATGEVIAQATFARVVAPGATAQAVLSLNGLRVPEDDLLRYRLDATTAAGRAPIASNPDAVTVDVSATALRYDASTLAGLPPQNIIRVQAPEINLAGEVDFSGIIASAGRLVVTIDNDLPVPLNLGQIQVNNLDAVGGQSPGVLFQVGNRQIGPNASLAIPVDLNDAAISPRLSVNVVASSPGTQDASRITSESGVRVTVSGDVTVDELFYRPVPDTFSTAGMIDLDAEELTFGAGDYVEIESGTLAILGLVNELDLGIDQLLISVPEIRRAPYGPGDSLVIRFEGTVRDPANYRFRRIERESDPRDASIALDGLRIYPTGSAISYNVTAVTEGTNQTRRLFLDRGVRAAIQAQDLQVGEVAANINPFSVEITDDGDGNGRLDVLTESNVSDFGDLDALYELEFDGLSLVGSELTISLTTNITTDIDFYAAFLGQKTVDGTVDASAYLGGRGPYAVPAGDTVAATLVAGGSAIAPGNLIRLPIEGAPSPDQPVTRTFVLDASNSTIDAFISALPNSIRYVGKAVVQPNGGRAVLREPFTIEASLGAAIPFALGSGFSLVETIEDADLSDLRDIADGDGNVIVERAELVVEYANRLPVGARVQLQVLGEGGNVLITLPTGDPIRITPAPVDGSGTSQSAANGSFSFPLTREELRTMSSGRQIRVLLDLDTNEGASARLRASDTFQFSLTGNFRVTLQSN